MIGPGSRLEKYEIAEKVGEGGMATVYRGRHTTLQREVAIKVMHPHLASSDRNRARFAREAKAIETLRHPNILRIFDYSGADADHCFIITEYIEGPTLRELLDDVGAMMPEPAALAVWELCRALELAHDGGIVHRDIKPENVMLTSDGTLKLMDFGIARMLDDAQVTMTGALVGSPAYMSPEQATDGKVGPASDLFAVGTMLYRMVTGTLPFRGSNPSIVIKAIIDGIYEDPANRVPSLSPALADIIRRCLNRDLEVRYTSAKELRADLAACLQDVGIDPEAPKTWSIGAYLADFDAYEDALRIHLLETLVTRGRAEAEAGRTAEALRTFNRVLALDDDNEEVVEIIEGMRTPIPDESGSGRGLWMAMAALLAAVASALYFLLPGGEEPVAALDAAVLLPTIPVPIPDQEEAPPPPEPTPQTVAKAAELPPALRVEAATRTFQVVVPPKPDPTPAVPDATPDPGPESCEGEGIVRIVAEKHWTHVKVNGAYILENGRPRIYDVRGGVLKLAAGNYTVTLDHTYRRPESHQIQVCGDRDPVVLVADAPLRPHRVAFEDFPAGARVLVNEEQRGTTDEPILLPSGEGYRVEVVHAGEVLASELLVVGEKTKNKHPGKTTVIRPEG